MDLKPLIDTVAPTPFGWVITTQSDFDLHSMLEFQKQLLTLSRVFGPSRVDVGVQSEVHANKST
jgi:hypothetical protein